MENPSSTVHGGRSSASTSPEFEFWMIRNPSSQPTPLHSADELFSGGLLLPLHHLNPPIPDDPLDNPTTQPANPPPIDSTAGSDLRTTATATASKRWKDLFKKNPEIKEVNDQKKKKKERNGGSGGGGGGGGGTSSAELNINIWPFSRSRSAGNGGSRPRTAANRKVSSAPCSRSNSTGESKLRKWPSSPNRGGVHLGRSSPVWQVKRFGQSRSLHDNVVRTAAEKSSRPAKGSGKGLSINVPTCIGYRQRMSCRSEVVDGGGKAEGAAVGGGEGGGGGSGLFSLRSLFTKKVF